MKWERAAVPAGKTCNLRGIESCCPSEKRRMTNRSGNSILLALLIILGVGGLAAKIQLDRRRAAIERALNSASAPADHPDSDTASDAENFKYVETNYDLVEPRLYVGGFASAPPPGTQAVLGLSMMEDTYQVPSHRWQPIPDDAPAPSLEWLRSQVAFIDAHLHAGETVYVHCDAGVSRAPMVVTAYLMWRHDLSRDDALAVLRAHRREASPNSAFMELLLDWQDEMQNQ
jgi:hypothetical protein